MDKGEQRRAREGHSGEWVGICCSGRGNSSALSLGRPWHVERRSKRKRVGEQCARGGWGSKWKREAIGIAVQGYCHIGFKGIVLIA